MFWNWSYCQWHDCAPKIVRNDFVLDIVLEILDSKFFAKKFVIEVLHPKFYTQNFVIEILHSKFYLKIY